MSGMQRNKGIIKRLSTRDNAKEVFDKLVAEEKIDPKWCETDENGVHYIDSENYEVVNGAIFDVSGAPDEYDPAEDVNEAERLNDTDYRVHAHFYNGGASFGEMLGESIPKADEKYKRKKTDWKDVSGIRVRMLLSKYEDASVKYTFEGNLSSLLVEDDGGFYGEDQARCDAAQEVDGDHMLFEDWQVDSVEYRVL